MNNLIDKDYFLHESSYIDEGATVGSGTYIWHFTHIMTKSKIGHNCNIGQNVVISPLVTLGDNCKIQNNVSIYTGVTCSDDVFLGPSMVFTNVVNPRSSVNRRGEYLKTHVGKGASIGANATIICGNNIGEHSFVGAGAVVTKSVRPYSLVIGNPAKHIGWISRHGCRLEFNEDGLASCNESKEEYKLVEEKVVLKGI